ncbi:MULTISPECIES: EF-P beta-lysylation protein EpmB [unclassified Salinivibrio]|uniref:EF-P beta-lysylation protein EpmB n=1 Tax=unclassified Salinivibrio TaxID=2636825 RepID=UPI00128BCD6E|nr:MULTISPECIES: EF-P beta-lysylation protein EpmB [unclassified Salinivibrio]MPS32891.1 EF-P beta-lysylation protein EpmB [Salinivibrio sp. VYel7]MPX91036.1 EF-P beta-lysylation protein EpmB [Salinivibrio sp. VYel1]MPX94279.1 EF-P beta-lysylation protein EpmB [Salinivibrio sp. VYel9]MPX97343.1 EF-P beta-lysylation protein EpmB [Salinivibrio sp. VYel6]MPY00565.1 EF-P beta-lysylation protein EpmB [Salinivibrio sp. VYel4]
MSHIITRIQPAVERNWIKELAEAITDPSELLQTLEISPKGWEAGFAARRLFTQRVPRSFVARMEKGNPNDPLLKQVLPVADEFTEVDGFSADPLEEQDNAIPGLLHKYHNRVLLIVKGGCAINCRYCFRRHFPYQDNKGSKRVWQGALDYIAAHAEIDEVILSGGDPLMAKDEELDWLISAIEQITHVKRLRIHSRLPVVIPARLTSALTERLSRSRLQVVMVTHINHANEIDDELSDKLHALRQAGITLLNQSVLLKGVNDSADALVALSQRLFEAGVLPYYLHVLDKVQGAAHFLVSDDEARALVQDIIGQLSGYLVPRLTREIGGRASKTPLDLHLE